MFSINTELNKGGFSQVDINEVWEMQYRSHLNMALGVGGMGLPKVIVEDIINGPDREARLDMLENGCELLKRVRAKQEGKARKSDDKKGGKK